MGRARPAAAAGSESELRCAPKQGEPVGRTVLGLGLLPLPHRVKPARVFQVWGRVGPAVGPRVHWGLPPSRRVAAAAGT